MLQSVLGNVAEVVGNDIARLKVWLSPILCGQATSIRAELENQSMCCVGIYRMCQTVCSFALALLQRFPRQHTRGFAEPAVARRRFET